MKKINTRKSKALKLMLLIVVICSMCVTMVACSLDSSKDKIPIPEVKENVYVYDADDVIDDDVESKINKILISLEEKTGAEFAVITVTSLLDMEIEDYSYELANELGIGKADEDNGVLLLISKSDTRVRLEIGTGLEGCLNDSKCGRILDNYFVPHREKDEYTEGTYKTVEAVVAIIAKEYEVSIDEINGSVAEDLEKEEAEETKSTIIFVGILALIVIAAFVLDGIFLDGAILGALLSNSSSGGSSSSGGFGGGGFSGGGASR